MSAFLAPLYFGLAGLRLNLWSVLEWNTSGLLLTVLSVAFVSKLIGVYLGAWIAGLSKWERVTLGFGMNARGGHGNHNRHDWSLNWFTVQGNIFNYYRDGCCHRHSGSASYDMGVV